MNARTCIVCLERAYDHAHVCDPCRRHLHHLLADIETLWRRLPEALQPARGGTQRVSGSRTPPVPVNLDSVDLSGLARAGSRAPFARGQLGLDDCQVGHLPVATTLESIVRVWRDVLCPGQHLPQPDVPSLIRWLDHRARDACDGFLAVDETYTELRELKASLRGVLVDYPQPPDLCDGIACRKCDMRALYRGDRWITCGSCGLLYSQDEYREWVGLLAAEARRIAA